MTLPRWMYVAAGAFWLVAAVVAVGELYMLRDEGRHAQWWWIAAYAGAGFVAALLLFCVQSFVFPGGLTRDPRRQAQNVRRAALIGLPLAAVGFALLGTKGPPVDLAVSAATVVFLTVAVGWRSWFRPFGLRAAAVAGGGGLRRGPPAAPARCRPARASAPR